MRVSKGDHSETRESACPLEKYAVSFTSMFQMRIFSPSGFCNINRPGGMNLEGAVLIGANLTAENLCDADLSDAKFRGGSAVYGGL